MLVWSQMSCFLNRFYKDVCIDQLFPIDVFAYTTSLGSTTKYGSYGRSNGSVIMYIVYAFLPCFFIFSFLS